MDQHNWALFDFDHTMTSCHSIIPFITNSFSLKKRLSFYIYKIPLWAMSYPFSKLSFKENLISHFLTQMPESTFEKLCKQFSTDILISLIKPSALKLIDDYKSKGFKIGIISASPESYLKPLEKSLNIDIVLGTKLSTYKGVLTGSIEGNNCKGKEKIKRFRAIFPNQQHHIIHAYGDSNGDKELLAAAQNPHYREI